MSIGVRTYETDEEGQFFLTDVPAGEQLIVAEKENYEKYEEKINVPSQDTKSYNIKMQPEIEEEGGIEGTVKDSDTNEPLAGVTILIANQDTETDSSGYYELDEIPAGEQTFNASKDGYKDYEETVVIPADGTKEYDFEMQPEDSEDRGNVEGTVREKGSGEPLKGVSVRIGTLETQTDSDGEYELEEISAGEREIVAHKDGYIAYSEKIQVIAQETKTHDIELVWEDAILIEKMEEMIGFFIGQSQAYVDYLLELDEFFMEDENLAKIEDDYRREMGKYSYLFAISYELTNLIMEIEDKKVDPGKYKLTLKENYPEDGYNWLKVEKHEDEETDIWVLKVEEFLRYEIKAKNEEIKSLEKFDIDPNLEVEIKNIGEDFPDWIGDEFLEYFYGEHYEKIFDFEETLYEGEAEIRGPGNIQKIIVNIYGTDSFLEEPVEINGRIDIDFDEENNDRLEIQLAGSLTSYNLSVQNLEMEFAGHLIEEDLDFEKFLLSADHIDFISPHLDITGQDIMINIEKEMVEVKGVGDFYVSDFPGNQDEKIHMTGDLDLKIVYHGENLWGIEQMNLNGGLTVPRNEIADWAGSLIIEDMVWNNKTGELEPFSWDFDLSISNFGIEGFIEYSSNYEDLLKVKIENTKGDIKDCGIELTIDLDADSPNAQGVIYKFDSENLGEIELEEINEKYYLVIKWIDSQETSYPLPSFGD